MSLVNIPRYRDDPNYRYKMPRIQSKIEGRGNGTKTNILNMGDIARALKRPPTYATKFFGCELGAMSKFEESEEKALINGAHTEKSLMTILDKFIELYVLCSNCQLPEIEVFVRKGILSCSCNACGYKGTLDMTHKAASYMIKNPVSTMVNSKKTNSSSVSNSSGTRDGKKSVKKAVGKDDDDLDSPSLTPPSAGTTAVDSNKKSSKTSMSSGIIDGKGDSSSKSKDKRRRRKKDDGTIQDRVDDDDEDFEELTVESLEINDIITRLRSFLNNGELKTGEDFSEELHMLQLSQGFDNVCRLYIALCAIFSEDEGPLTIELFRNKFDLVKCATKYSMLPREILCALETFIVVQHENQLVDYPYYCQTLYNNDLVEGNDLIRYYNKTTRYTGLHNKSYLQSKNAITPFIQWLKND